MTDPLSRYGAIDIGSPLLALLDDLVNVMFCAKDLDRRYLECNQAFLRRSGRRSKRDVLGRRATDLFPAPLAERYEEQDRRVLASGEPLRDELELIRRPDGSTGWYLTTKRPMHDRAGATIGLVSISRDLVIPDEKHVALASLEATVSTIRASFGAALSVRDLAAAADTTVAQLDRRMRKVFGLTTSQYILRARIDRAAELMTSTDLAVAAISADCGFYDQAAFSKQFSRLIGETPSQFRKHQAAGR